jgi:CBS-domain-containing membrane protein
MHHTTVADVMSTNVISARRQDSFAHLTTLLRGAAIRAVPVVDDDGTLLGVVSEADLMAAVARPEGYEARRWWWRPRHIRRQAPESKAGATTAADLMTIDVETATPATRVSAAARAMLRQHLSWMPVCDEDRRVVGVLGRSDVLTVFVRDDASIRAEIVDDVLRCILLADPGRVLVDVDGGVVTLTGELDTRRDARVTVRLIERVEGVVAVVDHLRYRTDERVADASATPMY